MLEFKFNKRGVVDYNNPNPQLILLWIIKNQLMTSDKSNNRWNSMQIQEKSTPIWKQQCENVMMCGATEMHMVSKFHITRDNSKDDAFNVHMGNKTVKCICPVHLEKIVNYRLRIK